MRRVVKVERTKTKSSSDMFGSQNFQTNQTPFAFPDPNNKKLDSSEIMCPKCEKIMVKPAFFYHYFQNHSVNIMDSDETIKFEENMTISDCYVRIDYDEIFLIKLDIANNKIYCGVYNINPQKIYKFKIKILQDKVTLDESFEKLVKPYESKLSPNYFEDLYFKSIEMKTGTSVSVSINLLEDEKTTDWRQISEKLQCPVCFEYFKTPVYQCLNGHALCDNCKKKLQQCPICQGLFTGRSNIVESIAEDIRFPCKFTGCKENFKISEKKAHENDCKFKL